MVSARRLTSLFAAFGVAAAGSLLAVAPVVADTGDITYECTIPNYGTEDIDISLSTDAPETMSVGQQVDPILTVRVVIPANIIGLAKAFGYTHASADGTIGVGVNGKEASLAATYPKTRIPSSGDYVVDIPIPLPRLAPTSAGTVTYTPGPLDAKLSIYQGEDDQTADSITANCVVKDPEANPVIDTVAVSKSEVAGIGFVVKSKPTATKRGRVVVALKSPAGVRSPTGKVVLVLKKGRVTKRVARTVAAGKKTVVLPKLAKGRWKVSVRYAGDARYHSASKNFRFRVAR